MALKDLLQSAPLPPTPITDRPPGITCDRYQRGEGKRCAHYGAGGLCALPGIPICTEWQKANAPTPCSLPVVAAPVVGPPTPRPRARDLFGNPIQIPEQPPKPKPVAPTTPAAPPRPERSIAVDLLRGLTTEDLESFRALGVEVLLHSESYGELWLVPAYTGKPRKEITPEHAATVVRVVSVFPGSHVVAFVSAAKEPKP